MVTLVKWFCKADMMSENHCVCFRAGVICWKSPSPSADHSHSSTYHHHRHEIPVCVPQSVSLRFSVSCYNCNFSRSMRVWLVLWSHCRMYRTRLHSKSAGVWITAVKHTGNHYIQSYCTAPTVYFRFIATSGCLQYFRNYLCQRKAIALFCSIPVLFYYTIINASFAPFPLQNKKFNFTFWIFIQTASLFMYFFTLFGLQHFQLLIHLSLHCQ